MEIKPADKEIIDHKDLRYKRKVSNKGIKDMNKQAYEHTVGLVLREGISKKAAPDVSARAGTRPKYVPSEALRGKENPYMEGTYLHQLLNNRRARYKDPMDYQLPAEPHIYFSEDGKEIIKQSDLDQTRDNKSFWGAYSLYPMFAYPDKYNAAKKYLMDRGAENQKRFQEGTLRNNEPSKVKFPDVITDPEIRRKLDVMGAGMANARIPGKTNNTTVG